MILHQNMDFSTCFVTFFLVFNTFIAKTLAGGVNIDELDIASSQSRGKPVYERSDTGVYGLTSRPEYDPYKNIPIPSRAYEPHSTSNDKDFYHDYPSIGKNTYVMPNSKVYKAETTEKPQSSTKSNETSVAIPIICATVGTFIGTIFIILVWNWFKIYCQRKKVNPSERFRKQSRCNNSTSSVYETIPESNVARNPAVNKQCSVKVIDMSERPLVPPPQPRIEENPYLHYDTVYEQRIFRLGKDGPILHVSDRCLPITAVETNTSACIKEIDNK